MHQTPVPSNKLDYTQKNPFLENVGDGPNKIFMDKFSGHEIEVTAAEIEFLKNFESEKKIEQIWGTNTHIDLITKGLVLSDKVLRNAYTKTLYSFDIELASSCNASCIFCPRKQLEEGRGFGIMRKANFLRYAEQIAQYAKRVAFVGIGEPTLSGYLPEAISFFRKRGIFTALVTNASLLTAERIQAILDSGPNIISISFNGGSKESYESTMLGLDFDSVVSNVRLLLEKNTDDIKIVLTAVATSKYTPSRSEIENLFLPWKPAISISGCHSRGGTIDNLVTAIPESMGLSRCGLYNSHNFLSWKGTLHACCHEPHLNIACLRPRSQKKDETRP